MLFTFFYLLPLHENFFLGLSEAEEVDDDAFGLRDVSDPAVAGFGLAWLLLCNTCFWPAEEKFDSTGAIEDGNGCPSSTGICIEINF